jgi:hypothetical protein
MDGGEKTPDVSSARDLLYNIQNYNYRVLTGQMEAIQPPHPPSLQKKISPIQCNFSWLSHHVKVIKMNNNTHKF